MCAAHRQGSATSCAIRLYISFPFACSPDFSDRTFTGLGKVALWTKADSVTRFGRLESGRSS